MLSLSRMVMEEQEHQNVPQILSPSTTSRSSNDSNSPEFEFWMVRNPSCPQPDLHSADELFSDGILLPLDLLQPSESSSAQNNPPPTPQDGEEEAEAPPGSVRPEPELTSAFTNLSPSAFTSSKRWRDIIFKKIDRNGSRNGGEDGKEKDKAKEKEKKKKKKKSAMGNVTGGGVVNGGVTAAELNINIWPFRSRSAGNGGSRPRMSSAGSTRKASSAPCSRSNSAGESKSRKWPSSPNRGGLHLGRSSPVWQVRRGGGRSSEAAAVKSAEKGIQKEGNEARRKNTPSGGGGGGGGQKARVLNINVPPMCIGYRQQLSCRSDEISVTETAAGGGGGGESVGAASGEVVRGSNIFNIKSLFTKKVY